MLNPNNDRLDYGQLLTAPDKYKLDFAIGTTYSLDLDALVGASLALGLSEDTDSKIAQNPIALLEALRVTGNKIALFCEAGQIHLPNKVTSLYMLLEQMVYQVKTPKKKGIAAYPSFHPKFWLIRYVNEQGEPLYRVVILSRNLTFDRSWDVTFCMDGKKSNKATDKNQPVNDFIEYLLKFMPVESQPGKRTKIRRILKELSYIHFETDSREFYDYDFIPVGVKQAQGGFHNIKEYPLFTDTFHEILVMSPFLSDGIIKDFNDRNKYIEHTDYTLITRAMSLPRLKPESCANFKIYTVKDNVIDGESIVSEENNNIQKQDIHAKVYMVRKNSDADLYLGSLNASHNAVSGNIEFMIRLRSKNRYLNLTKLSEALFCGNEDNPNNPFQLVDINSVKNEEVVDADSVLDSVIKTIIRLNPSAEVVENGENYNINVFFDSKVEGYAVSVSPLFSNKTAPLSEKVCFENLSLLQLSEFYKITVADGENVVSRVIIIPTANLPEDRDKAVVSSVVKDKNCFYQYISFLLGENFTVGASELFIAQNETAGAVHTTQTIMPALYEKMLQTAANDPQKFDEIEYLMKAVSKDGVVPEKFEETYKMFRKAVGLRG